MSKVLVKFEDNWADEMDIEGFQIMNECDWKQFETSEDYPSEVYFGTNEYNEYETKEDFLENFSVEPITEEEAKVIEKFFGDFGGHFPL